MVLELTETIYKQEIAKGPIIVDFTASWCRPCQMLAPIFEDLSEEYQGTLKFAKISTEEYSNPAREAGVRSIPCLIMFKDNKVAGQIIGFMPREQLKEHIDALLKKIK